MNRSHATGARALWLASADLQRLALQFAFANQDDAILRRILVENPLQLYGR